MKRPSGRRPSSIRATRRRTRTWRWHNSRWPTVPPTPAGFEGALAAAEQAVALAPGLASGYSARGFLRAVYRFDFPGAQATWKERLPSARDTRCTGQLAVLLGMPGDLQAAIPREEKALELDPLSEEICRRLGSSSPR